MHFYCIFDTFFSLLLSLFLFFLSFSLFYVFPSLLFNVSLSCTHHHRHYLTVIEFHWWTSIKLRWCILNVCKCASACVHLVWMSLIISRISHSCITWTICPNHLYFSLSLSFFSNRRHLPLSFLLSSTLAEGKISIIYSPFSVYNPSAHLFFINALTKIDHKKKILRKIMLKERKKRRKKEKKKKRTKNDLLKHE